MTRKLSSTPLPGFDPEIGRWLWAMEEARRGTVAAVKGLDQQTLDWEGPDSQENAIGSLLYHIALVEMGWLFTDIVGCDVPPEVRADFPQDFVEKGGRLARVLGMPLSEHLARLGRCRAIFLDVFRKIPAAEWDVLRTPADDADYTVMPAWAVFHLVEHEAGHAFQIRALRARAARALGRD